MNVIIGLGNPGKNYELSRHNSGFMVLDELALSLGLTWEATKKVSADVAKGSDLLLLKSQTFMNESGKALRATLEYYKIAPTQTDQFSQVWVVLDDLDLELGSYKIQFGTGPKVHNGLLSVYQELGTTQFWHVRVGIDSRTPDQPRIPGRDYVLQPFTPIELQQLEPVISAIVNSLKKTILSHGGDQ